MRDASPLPQQLFVRKRLSLSLLSLPRTPPTPPQTPPRACGALGRIGRLGFRFPCPELFESRESEGIVSRPRARGRCPSTQIARTYFGCRASPLAVRHKRDLTGLCAEAVLDTLVSLATSAPLTQPLSAPPAPPHPANFHPPYTHHPLDGCKGIRGFHLCAIVLGLPLSRIHRRQVCNVSVSLFISLPVSFSLYMSLSLSFSLSLFLSLSLSLALSHHLSHSFSHLPPPLSPPPSRRDDGAPLVVFFTGALLLGRGRPPRTIPSGRVTARGLARPRFVRWAI